MNTFKRPLLAIALVAISPLFMVATASAWQDDPVVEGVINVGAQMPAELQKAMVRQFEQQLESQKEYCEQRMSVRIDDMTSNCELDKKQVLKLKVAAKGAIANSMKKFRERTEKMFGEMGIEVEEPNVADSEQGDSDVPEEPEQPAEIQIGGNAFFAAPVIAQSSSGQLDPEGEDVWTKAVSTTLSKEQQSKYDKVIQERKQFQRQSAVNSFIARADKELLLTTEQRTAMYQHIDKEYGEALVSRGLQTDDFVRPPLLVNGANGVFRIGNEFVEEPQDREDSAVKGILTAKQLKIWERAFEPELSMLNNTGGPFEFFGN